MKGNYDCPSCGGTVTFQSSIAVFAVCPHCRSMVVRHDLDVEAIGQMAQLPPDLSPLQLGAHGECDGQGFTLIGRVRLAYEDGSWNEWCALFGDNRYGWVAETQGFFMVSFECALPPQFPSGPGGLPVGHTIEIEGQSYSVNDRKETVCLGGEGELPFTATSGHKAFSIDLTGADGRYACAVYADDELRLFVGRYARFDDLNFSGLRAVPGWTEEGTEPIRNQTTSLTCPNCGSAVTLRAAGLTMSATCGSCGSLIDTTTPELSLIRRAQERQRLTPQIPIGRRGFLFGVNYEVIGFQRVKDQYSGWSEFLLFNPWQGFLWLVTYNGHWSFVRRLVERPVVSESGVLKPAARAEFKGETYRLFAVSQVTTEYVLGEFYWKVKVGMPVYVSDFVCPPRILSREAYPQLGEETWSQGEYIEPKVIAEAFNLTDPMREPIGIYLNQPNRFAEKGRQLKWCVPLFAAALIFIQLFSASRAARQPVFDGNYLFHAGATNPVVVTDPFEIQGGNQTVEFNLSAPVNNNWLELDVDLVDAATQQPVATFEQGIEYYHGYDDGEWSEGRQSEHRLVPAIAPGKYYLAIDAFADTAIAEMPFTVSAVRDVMVWSNFWIALGLLLVYPVYCWLRAGAFESARWADSDFSPYGSSSSDDD